MFPHYWNNDYRRQINVIRTIACREKNEQTHQISLHDQTSVYFLWSQKGQHKLDAETDGPSLVELWLTPVKKHKNMYIGT